MKKITETKNMLEDIDYLIRSMESEINTLRYIVYRYYLQHGEVVYSDELAPLPDEIDFTVKRRGEKAMCEKINYNDVRLKSNFQDIQERIKKLSQ